MESLRVREVRKNPVFQVTYAYQNVINGFRQPLVSLFYIAAMLMAANHLSHGIWSMFQSMGFSHPQYTPRIKTFSAVFAWILIAGFISVPIAVLTGLVR